MKMTKKSIVVLGAGLSGLSIAYNLKKLGTEVKILEKNTIGGLANSISYGPYVFDIGAHIFRTTNKKLLDFVLSMTKTKKILSNAGMWKNNVLQTVPYPIISRQNIDFLGSSKIRNSLKEYSIKSNSKSIASTDSHSFEQVIKSQVGNTLYREFFGDYAEKFWGLNSSKISGKIAPQNISVQEKGGWAHITQSFHKAKHEIYPVRGGSSSFVRGLTQKCKRLKIPILTGISIINIEHKLNKVEITYRLKDKIKKESFDFVFSTIPLTTLGTLLSIKNSLSYRSMIIVDTAVKKPKVFDKSWVYFHDKDIDFIRATDMNNYGQNMCPKNNTGLMFEVPCEYNDKIWNDPKIDEKLIDQFLSTKLINKKEIKTLGIRKIRFAYPLFQKGYVVKLKRFMLQLHKLGKICVGGRTGSFTYLNMDGCMKYLFFDLHKEMNTNSVSLESL